MEKERKQVLKLIEFRENENKQKIKKCDCRRKCIPAKWLNKWILTLQTK